MPPLAPFRASGHTPVDHRHKHVEAIDKGNQDVEELNSSEFVDGSVADEEDAPVASDAAVPGQLAPIQPLPNLHRPLTCTWRGHSLEPKPGEHAEEDQVAIRP
jgi:hypothetical protein